MSGKGQGQVGAIAVRTDNGGAMHPVIFLWSHPRSMSSAMERVMLERGDMTTFHEPFLYLYYVHDGKKRMPHHDIDPHRPTSYPDIRSMILDAARTRPVFVKDMCYYVSDHIHADPELIRRISNTFLIRDPARSIPSYYRLDPGVTLEEIGHEAQYRYFERVADITGERPIVIEATDLADDTAGTMRAYCGALGVRFIAEALQWDGGELPSAWGDVSGWHGDLVGARGITKSKPSSGVGLDAAPHLREYYRHHLPFYQEMLAHRLPPAPG